ncbi:hypothetical protein CAMRE0001_0336 [Campylobacter rectus RM3267]|uniref:Uncharacterized protein n=1 Tax=Campylobacter rectus RM3267 TaxID=553218 RepID=B9D5Y7_CAMRE|nr:hypothetical protein CAMRE0001_0336 [Campylobacter rectus RM3267]
MVRDGARRFLVCIVTGSVKETNFIFLYFKFKAKVLFAYL